MENNNNNNNNKIENMLLNHKVNGGKKDVEKLESELRRMREAAAEKKEAKSKHIEEQRRVKEGEMKEWMEWVKPRDDLLCDDLKDLPSSTAVDCRGVSNCRFGELLFVVEFVLKFKTLLSLHTPKNFNIETLHQGLLEVNPKGVYSSLTQSLLSSLLSILSQECSLSNLDFNKDNENTSDENLFIKAVKMSLKDYGTPLHNLPLDDFTVSEVVRNYLVVVEGGKGGRGGRDDDTGEAAGDGDRVRSVSSKGERENGQKGAFAGGIENLLKGDCIFSLSPDDKLQIISLLSHHLLGTSVLRDFIDESSERLKSLTKELKSHQIIVSKREKDEAQYWAKKKQEGSLKAFLQGDKEEDKTREAEEGSRKSARRSSSEDLIIPDDYFTKLPTHNLDWEKVSKSERDQLKDWESRKERSLISQLTSISDARSYPVAYDRTHRRYWLLKCLPVVFVEDEEGGVASMKRKLVAQSKGNTRNLNNLKNLLKTQEKMDKKLIDFINNVSAINSNNNLLSVASSSSISSSGGGVGGSSGGVSGSSGGVGGNGVGSGANINGGSITNGNSNNVSGSSNLNVSNTSINSNEDPSKQKCSMTSIETQLSNKGVVRWSFYHSSQQLKLLIGGLNMRGNRESVLHKCLKEHQRVIEDALKDTKKVSTLMCFLCGGSDEAVVKMDVGDGVVNGEVMKQETLTNGDSHKVTNTQGDIKPHTDTKGHTNSQGDTKTHSDTKTLPLESFFIESLLDLEERIFTGSLGKFKGVNRMEWRRDVEGMKYQQLLSYQNGKTNNNNNNNNNNINENNSDSNNLDSNNNNSNNNNNVNSNSVRVLAGALVTVEQMIEERFLKQTLGFNVKKLKKFVKADLMREDDHDSDDETSSTASNPPTTNNNNPPPPTTTTTTTKSVFIEYWELRVRTSQNLSQLFLYMSVLDSNIVWSKSALNAHCRICRRRKDPECMLLCDMCDKGHHTFCLRPPVHDIPEGDWFCPWCKPPELLSPKRRRPRDEEDEDVSDDNDLDETEMNSEDSRNEDEEDEDPAKIMNKNFYAKKKKKDTTSKAKNDGKKNKKGGKRINESKNGRRKCQKKCNYYDEDEEDDDDEVNDDDDEVNNDEEDEGEEETAGVNIDEENGKDDDDDDEKVGDDNDEKEDDGSDDDNDDGSDDNDGNDSEEADQLKNKNSRKRKASREKKPISKKRKLKNGSVDSGGVGAGGGRKSFRSYSPLPCLPLTTLTLSQCQRLVDQLVNAEDCWPFLEAVSKEEVPDYSEVITNPMDFSTIGNKLQHHNNSNNKQHRNNNTYSTASEVLADINLIFNNCKLYNEPSTVFYKLAVKMQKLVEKKVKSLSSGGEGRASNESKSSSDDSDRSGGGGKQASNGGSGKQASNGGSGKKSSNDSGGSSSGKKASNSSSGRKKISGGSSGNGGRSSGGGSSGGKGSGSGRMSNGHGDDKLYPIFSSGGSSKNSSQKVLKRKRSRLEDDEDEEDDKDDSDDDSDDYYVYYAKSSRNKTG